MVHEDRRHHASGHVDGVVVPAGTVVKCPMGRADTESAGP